VQQAAAAASLVLDAASHGIAPAVFATTLVTDADEYEATKDFLLPADAAGTSEMRAGRASSRRISALVTVSQLHTFRLSDMLRAYVGMGPADNRGLARREIQGAVAEIAAKTKQLADYKVLKLSMSPDSVVFCPELVEVDAGADVGLNAEWELRGYGFADAVQGRPYLTDFDPRVCKRLVQQDGFDPNGAFVLMMLVFLAAVRAQFAAAYPVVLAAVLETPFAKLFPAAADKADAFGGLFRRAFQHTRVERDPLPASTLAEVSQDFAHLVRDGSFAGLLSEDAERPAFHQLLLWLLGTRAYAPDDPFTDEELALDRESRLKESARRKAVLAARRERLLARRKAAK